MKTNLSIILLVLFQALSLSTRAQFSPGELSAAHAKLEGLSNCTKCHDIGAKVSDKKCLDCHKEINSLINARRGYHSSAEVKGKSCIRCHSEHHGRQFDATRFDQKKFNHELAGYKLQGKHGTVDCKACHKPDFISNPDIRNRKGTFLGLGTDCISCHTDYHQGTLSKSCNNCHGFERFKDVPYFDHAKTKFPLQGAHTKVDCALCHRKSIQNGKEFQQFSGLKYKTCTGCHADVHDNKFGQNCTDCHNNTAWKQLKSGNRFDHNLTRFPLTGMHTGLACVKCHKKGNYSKPMASDYCYDCHEDYHQGEFSPAGKARVDCRDCHSVDKAFSNSSYGIERHQQSGFRLEGAHLATPCTSCHKKSTDKRWAFKFASTTCVSCHEDIHSGYISERYYPEQSCQSCHNSGSWTELRFDHKQTQWSLEGKHAQVSCRQCHIADQRPNGGTFRQEFKGKVQECSGCHEDAHAQQFAVAGKTDCKRCHSSATAWNADNFNHDRTAFPLTGRHKEIECGKCHKPMTSTAGGKPVIEYKIKNYRCIDCH